MSVLARGTLSPTLTARTRNLLLGLQSFTILALLALLVTLALARRERP